MEEMRGITVKVPAALHAKATEERDAQDPPMTMSQYITAILEEHFNNKMEGGKNMNSNNRTLAFQVPEELFYRVKTYLTAHTTNGRKLSQRDFVVGLIEQELDRWEAEQQADGSTVGAEGTDYDITEDSENDPGTDDTPEDGENGLGTDNTPEDGEDDLGTDNTPEDGENDLGTGDCQEDDEDLQGNTEGNDEA